MMAEKLGSFLFIVSSTFLISCNSASGGKEEKSVLTDKTEGTAQCRIARPIELGASDLSAKVPMILKNVKFFNTIRTQAIDAADVHLIKIFSLGSSFKIGASIHPVFNLASTGISSQSLGFSPVDDLGGDVHDITARRSRRNGTIIYSAEQHHSSNSSNNTCLRIEIEENKIVSFEMRVPIAEIDGHGFSRNTGESEAICLESADISPSGE